jgi:sugar O-acyltransferase (sialic acid O-acetyltransferase NeuD family)
VQEIVIVGAGGHGSEVRAYVAELRGDSGVRLLGFIDDNQAPGPWCESEILGGLPKLDALAIRFSQHSFGYITAIGENPTRCRIVRTIEGFGHRTLHSWTLQHPTAHVGSEVQIGHGTLLAPHVIITTQVRIGNHCILNVKSSISHDCIIGDFVNINPGATICGRVTIGDGAYIGAGAVVKDRIHIGRGVIIGAGAVVVRDLPDGVTAVGVPARVIKDTTIDWLNI